MGLLKAAGIEHFGFDFRPRSFNFIQTYRLVEIIREHFSLRHTYDLHFCGEKDFVISKIVADMDHQLVDQSGRNIWDHARLEFSDTEEIAFYDQFNAPFILHYHQGLQWEKISKAKNIMGLVIPYPYLLELHEKNEFTQFIMRFNQEKQRHMPHGDMYLTLDWGANIFPTLFEFLDVGVFDLPVNWKLESGYRKIDPVKFNSEWKVCRDMLLNETSLQHT